MTKIERCGTCIHYQNVTRYSGKCEKTKARQYIIKWDNPCTLYEPIVEGEYALECKKKYVT